MRRVFVHLLGRCRGPDPLLNDVIPTADCLQEATGGDSVGRKQRLMALGNKIASADKVIAGTPENRLKARNRVCVPWCADRRFLRYVY